MNKKDPLRGIGQIDEEFGLRRGTSLSCRHRFTEHYLADALGSTVGLTDGTGALGTEYSYAPFGAATASGPSSTNELGYTGREDDGTGVYYYRARYYHPGLQRFIGQDPIGFAGGDTNLYVYVANNPLLFVDPFGLDKTPRRQLKNCGGLPEVPLGQDIHGNVREMEQRSRFNIDNWLWFYYAVKSDGPWDYKQFGQGERQRVYKGAYNRYEAGGNFNYGATAAAFGIPDQVTLRMAGAYATWKGTSPPGVSWIFTPYGDDPLDQHWIEAGIAYYRCVARP